MSASQQSELSKYIDDKLYYRISSEIGMMRDEAHKYYMDMCHKVFVSEKENLFPLAIPFELLTITSKALDETKYNPLIRRIDGIILEFLKAAWTRQRTDQEVFNLKGTYEKKIGDLFSFSNHFKSFIELYRSFGIELEWKLDITNEYSPAQPHDDVKIDVYLHAKGIHDHRESKFSGHEDMYSRVTFDMDGNFIDQGFWE